MCRFYSCWTQFINQCIGDTSLVSLVSVFIQYMTSLLFLTHFVNYYAHTRRYAKSPSLYAVELINEPRSPGASLVSVIKYYRAGYNAVRKYSSTAYVVMSNRVGTSEPKELLPLASGLKGSVIDVHYYNLFSDIFDTMTVQQNINFINTNRSSDLSLVTTSNGPLTFVGKYQFFYGPSIVLV